MPDIIMVAVLHIMVCSYLFLFSLRIEITKLTGMVVNIKTVGYCSGGLLCPEPGIMNNPITSQKSVMYAPGIQLIINRINATVDFFIDS